MKSGDFGPFRKPLFVTTIQETGLLGNKISLRKTSLLSIKDDVAFLWSFALFIRFQYQGPLHRVGNRVWVVRILPFLQTRHLVTSIPVNLNSASCQVSLVLSCSLGVKARNRRQDQRYRFDELSIEEGNGADVFRCSHLFFLQKGQNAIEHGVIKAVCHCSQTHACFRRSFASSIESSASFSRYRIKGSSSSFRRRYPRGKHS